MGTLIWGILILTVTYGLRGLLAKLENGERVLPSLTSLSRIQRIGSRDEGEAVIATIRLDSGEMGDKEERKRILDLEDQLSDAIQNSSAGELDGDEFGGGTCTIFMYGSSAERLLSIIWPILKEFHAPSGSFVIKRCGNPREEHQISLDDH